MSSESYVRIEDRAGIRIVTLARPEKLNAWTVSMRRKITESLNKVNLEPGIDAVVISGSGRGFCAGQDLSETAEFEVSDVAQAREWVNGFRDLYAAIINLDKPVVAAVNGVAAGSGFQFALLADLRIGHAGVRMGQPEVKSGIPSITGIWAMLRVLSNAKTAELALTGRLVMGDEAYRLGLLTSLVDEDQVLAEAVERAQELAALPSPAVRLTKSELRTWESESFELAFERARRVHALSFGSGVPQREMGRFLRDGRGAE